VRRPSSWNGLERVTRTGWVNDSWATSMHFLRDLMSLQDGGKLRMSYWSHKKPDSWQAEFINSLNPPYLASHLEILLYL